MILPALNITILKTKAEQYNLKTPIFPVAATLH